MNEYQADLKEIEYWTDWIKEWKATVQTQIQEYDEVVQHIDFLRDKVKSHIKAQKKNDVSPFDPDRFDYGTHHTEDGRFVVHNTTSSVNGDEVRDMLVLEKDITNMFSLWVTTNQTARGDVLGRFDACVGIYLTQHEAESLVDAINQWIDTRNFS